jgi:hypothetical protein
VVPLHQAFLRSSREAARLKASAEEETGRFSIIE